MRTLDPETEASYLIVLGTPGQPWPGAWLYDQAPAQSTRLRAGNVGNEGILHAWSQHLFETSSATSTASPPLLLPSLELTWS